MKIRRRTFLGGALAAPALLDLLGADAAAQETEKRPLPAMVDVAIVGGGFAGLSAARRLAEAGKVVAVLEARDRIGGRTKTEQVAGGLTMDVGGQWIGPQQKRINRWVKDLGIATFKTFNEGKSVLVDGGKRSEYSGTIPKLGPMSLVSLGTAMAKMDRLAKKIDLEEPWKSKGAKHLDQQTLGGWIDRHVHATPARRLLRAGMRMIIPAEPSRVSMLHTLFFVHAAGGLDPLLAVENGAQQDRFRDGTASLAKALSAPFADSIHLETPVTAILQDGSGVTVVTDRGKVAAARAIVAVPPALAARIDYQPLLSADRDQLTQAVPMGSVLKCLAFYEKPFWRDAGLTGQAVSSTGPITATFDNSPESGTPGVMLGFVVGGYAESFRRLDPSGRKKTFLAELATFFGPKALGATDYVDHSWSDERWSRGGYLGYLPPGVWTTLGVALRRPEGRIHWAGTETAREWNGYIEGALESGERAATEALG